MRGKVKTDMAKLGEGLSGPDVKKMAAEWHGVALSDKRAAGLAEELNGLNTATRAAAQRLAYDVEPAAFVSALKRLKREGQT